MNQSLFEYILRLGDNSLILGHRLSEWCGNGPELEEDIALTNISLDLIGQATNFLEYASVLDENGRTADDLAYLRDISDFRCAALLQQPNGDFAQTIVRQYCFDQYQYILLEALVESKDEHLAAIAAKSIKEVSYHLRHSSEWVLRLGQGTEESHKRMQDAIHKLWKFTGDLFEQLESDEVLIAEGITPDMMDIQSAWEVKVYQHMLDASLQIPDIPYFFKGSRKGRHTEHLGYILAEMQFLPRAYPGVQW